MKKNAYVRLLKNGSFRSFWAATTLLRLASNILQFALAIYVLDLTESAFIYSTVLAIILVPRILCSTVAGYTADYRDNIRTIQIGCLGLTVMMLCFGMIHITFHPLNVPLIYLLVSCLELFETFLAPSESKAMLSIIEKEDLSPASKLSSLDDGIVEILSPLISSFFYGFAGLSGIFFIATLMESGSFFLAMLIHRRDKISKNTQANPSISAKAILETYRETIVSLKRYPYVIGIIFFAPLFNFFVSPLFSVIAPHFFCVTTMAEVDAYAVFNAIIGVAGLCAPFVAIVIIDDKDEYRANMAGTVFAIAVLLVLIVFLILGERFLIGRGMLVTITAAMALLMFIITIMSIASSITMKKYIPEQILGQVISMIQLCAVISVPLGQLFYGVCADRFPMVVSLMIALLGLIITYVVMHMTYQKLEK